MLCLLFQIGESRYAVDVRQVVEVVPLIDVRPIPLAPAGVIGICDYRGAPVPVIDLSQLLLGRPAERRSSTRLVIVHHPDEAGRLRPLGVVAERATAILRCEPQAFVAPGITPECAPYLGPVARDDRGLVQRIDVGSLLPAPVRRALLNAPLEP